MKRHRYRPSRTARRHNWQQAWRLQLDDLQLRLACIRVVEAIALMFEYNEQTEG